MIAAIVILWMISLWHIGSAAKEEGLHLGIEGTLESLEQNGFIKMTEVEDEESGVVNVYFHKPVDFEKNYEKDD